MQQPNLQIRIDDSAPVAVAYVSGELSGMGVEKFVESVSEFASGDQAKLAIDLSEVKLIDSTGLGSLIHIVTRSRLTNGRVALVSPSPFVSGILNVTRLDQWFEIFATHEDARRHLLEA